MKLILLVVVCILLGVSASSTLWAQNHKKERTVKVKADTDKSKSEKTHLPINQIPVFLANSNITGGVITPSVFDSLLKLGLRARDTAGHVFPVKNFMFDYAERSWYEDEQANMFIQTEHMQQYCLGDTISAGLAVNVYSRLKSGDSVFIDHINLQFPDSSKKGEGRPMIFSIMQKAAVYPY